MYYFVPTISHIFREALITFFNLIPLLLLSPFFFVFPSGKWYGLSTLLNKQDKYSICLFVPTGVMEGSGMYLAHVVCEHWPRSADMCQWQMQELVIVAINHHSGLLCMVMSLVYNILYENVKRRGASVTNGKVNDAPSLSLLRPSGIVLRERRFIMSLGIRDISHRCVNFVIS
jgi:hypothetical protein